MKALLLAATLTAGLAIQGAHAAAMDPGIQKTMDEFSAAWNKHDVNAMVACWLDNGDLINPVGRVAKGRAEMVKLFTDEHAALFKSSTFETHVTGSRALAPGVEWVDYDFTVKNETPEGAPPMDMHGHMVLVYKLAGKEWKVISARPYIFAPMGPPPAK